MEKKKAFLIVGAGFGNKGAQSMLYITVNELRKKYNDCIIYADVSMSVPQGYKFIPVNIIPWTWKSIFNYFYLFPATLRRMARRLLTRCEPSLSYFKTRSMLRKLDAIIDISGFALSSQFTDNNSVLFLDRIEAARKMNVPFFLMPQSFGPFDYKSKANVFDARIKDLLAYPRIIFAREQQGYDLLTKKFGLKNVKLSMDIVLQNTGIIESNVYEGSLRKKKYRLEQGKKVAIIPNYNMYRIGEKDKILNLLEIMAVKLLKDGYRVFLISHSVSDKILCQDLKDRLNNENIIWIKDDINPIEFSELISEFDFIIGSRYHAIVHALRKLVPAIIIGWAIKYFELMKLFGQEEFVIDINTDITEKRLLSLVEDMENNYEKYTNQINNILCNCSSNKCFEEVFSELAYNDN